jgi:lysozyme
MIRRVVYFSVLGAVGYWFYSASRQVSNVTSSDGQGASVIDVFNPFLNVAYSAGGAIGMGLGMQLSLDGINKIKNREGFSARPYKDIAGYWTVGYGHKMGALESYDTIDDATATKLLASDLATAENGVNSLVSVKLTQSQFDALVSFIYNVGVGAFKRSTMLKLINSGNYQNAALEFRKWAYAGGKLSNGLINRRNSEAAQFAYS